MPVLLARELMSRAAVSTSDAPPPQAAVRLRRDALRAGAASSCGSERTISGTWKRMGRKSTPRTYKDHEALARAT